SSGLDSDHPNNQGMPATLPKVMSWRTTFSQNSATQSDGHTAANGIGKNQDNADVYGSVSSPMPSAARWRTLRRDRRIAAASRTLAGYGGDPRAVKQGDKDLLLGMSRADTLLGNAGKDRWVGSTDSDGLLGGADADYFVFSGKTFHAALSHSNDRAMAPIKDINKKDVNQAINQAINVGQGDRICLGSDLNLRMTHLPHGWGYTVCSAVSPDARSLPSLSERSVLS
ncbi:MAG TPA: hypothetical protein V6C57_22425, partial [Coleofasciculaceae cyanobacterium]